MSTQYLVVGTEARVRSFILQLFVRRLCIPVATTIFNIYVVELLVSNDVVHFAARSTRTFLALLLAVLLATLAHLWTYALRTLSLYRAIVQIPSTEPVEPLTEKGDSTCNSVSAT